ncbi:HNH endonuclease [Vibrio alginolyticus]|uniref:HNH endonuclease n=1 Tax=Vibrio alginolyticus TaxID=663 RepID=UPI0021D20973
MYAVIVENDVSQWADDTGVLYHFPKRYLKYLEPGTQVIYYKGRIKDKAYQESRLSNEPHYFGIGTIGKVFPDRNSTKNDYFGTIDSFETFTKPILAKIDGNYLENIPSNLVSNYWRNGVRPISKENYELILQHLSEDGLRMVSPKYGTGESSEQSHMFESLHEGDLNKKYVTTYERNPKLRRQAIAIHGTSCAACGFDYGKVYGSVGEGYIHIHHKVPVSQFGTSKLVDPEKDLVPLCANCHAIVHRKKDHTLSVEELKQLLGSSSMQSI